MSAHRQYELIYILQPEVTDADIDVVQQLVTSNVDKYGGVLEKTDNWGRRKLAYDIGRFREGVYVLQVILGSGDLVKEIDRRLKVVDHVIRHLIVRVDETMRVANRRGAIRKAETARRRVARGLPPEPEPGEEQRSQDGDNQDLGGEV